MEMSPTTTGSKEEEITGDHALIGKRAIADEEAVGDSADKQHPSRRSRSICRERSSMTTGSDEVVRGDHALTDEDAAGDGSAKDDPMTEAAAAGETTILNPAAKQNFTPEQEVTGDPALINKRTHADVEENHKQPEEAAATKKRPVFLRQCQLLKAGKKFKKVMVPVNPEVAEAMLDWPRQDMSKIDELPEGFDDLPEVFRAAILSGRDLAKKLVKEEEDILEQFRTQGHAEMEAYVLE
ncbi:hypothetical protein PR202_ga22674 [Eleusine coracana subsp. coracana]|uniref:Uncharacterized protein n=1 Tax=Eleusine coracana subsp. coracana TaxID=191504 RepID=A0AAV5D3W2_ELECO|nr:hypothetical protein PR202_ga22674 [Eleusine coracana subsp. coracana]